MVIAGIDYSITSPSICIHDGDDWSYENCKFFFFGKKPLDNRYSASEYPKWKKDQERFQKLTAWTISCLDNYKIDTVYIEDYAFGAKGRVFHIAENTGLMKYALYVQGLQFNLISPTTIKKFATGKGNAKKDSMVEFFKTDTGVDIFSKLGVKEGQMTPSSDIVDSYWVCKYGYFNEKNDNSERTSE